MARFVSLQVAATMAAVASSSVVAQAAPSKAECVAANADGQNLRRDGKLAGARAALHSCSDPQCPTLVRDDCTKLLGELEALQPTVLFDAKDGSGRDLRAVSVTVDGRPLATQLDGLTLQVDPGEHEFSFTAPGEKPASLRLIIKEGEKARHERVVIGPIAVAPSASPVDVTTPSPGLGVQRIAGIGVASVGVVGIAVGSVFGILTSSAISKQKSDCASSAVCPHPAAAAADHSTWTSDGTVSTAAFIAGGVLIAGGAALFFTARHTSRESADAWSVTPGLSPAGGNLLLQGEF